MTQQIRFINPDALATPNGFSHVAVNATHHTVFISGQVAYNNAGQIVGEGDLGRQTAQTLENIGHALQSVGLGFEHVIKLTFFVVDLNEEAAMTIRNARKPYLLPKHLPASTMVGVASLAKEGLLLEVEAEAVIPLI